MKTNELWDTAIWLVNILLALGIMAFSFLYILFPSPRVEGAIDPASITGPESDGVEGPARKDIQHYRPTWDAKLTNPTPPPPVVNVVTPDKVYDFVGNLMGVVVLNNKSTGLQAQFKTGDSTPEGFTILEIRSASVVVGYKDGQGKPAQTTLAKEAPPGALGAPSAAAPSRGGGGPGGGGGPAAPVVGGGVGAVPPTTPATPAGEIGIAIDPADPKHVLVTPKERDWMAANDQQVLAEIKQRPYIPEGNQMRGMLIEEIKPEGRIARLGFKTKDVVRKVNGVPLDTTEKWRELFSDEKLRKQPSLAVEIERGGQTLELRFEVR